MTLLDGILLGAVQGVTEFLPVSSSGHLILLRDLRGINTDSGLAFDAVLQLATAFAILCYFWRDIWRLMISVTKVVIGRGASVAKTDKTLIAALIIGTIPAVILGLLLERTMETLFRNALLVAAALIAGSVLFVLAERHAKQTLEHPTVAHGWWVGLFQALALVPGVSRSGATISGGLFFGLTREAAARFAFLLSIPVILGSGLKKLLDIIRTPSLDVAALPLAVGFVVAFGTGILCIRFLLGYLKRHTLFAFVWYRLALAAVVVVFATVN
jgi:undecaprenyl-diphosphatase